MSLPLAFNGFSAGLVAQAATCLPGFRFGFAMLTRVITSTLQARVRCWGRFAQVEGDKFSGLYIQPGGVPILLSAWCILMLPEGDVGGGWQGGETSQPFFCQTELCLFQFGLAFLTSDSLGFSFRNWVLYLP